VDVCFKKLEVQKVIRLELIEVRASPLHDLINRVDEILSIFSWMLVDGFAKQRGNPPWTIHGITLNVFSIRGDANAW
jgi:hypothetical protein